MKKLFIIGLLLALLVPIQVWAAGSVTVTESKVGSHVIELTYTWTADSADGSVPSTSSTTISGSSGEYEGYVFLVITDPGSTAPTDNYDITLTDSNGVDIMGGELADRDTSNSEQAIPRVDAAFGSRWVKGAITLNISNNSANSATGVVKVYIYTDEETRL